MEIMKVGLPNLSLTPLPDHFSQVFTSHILLKKARLLGACLGENITSKAFQCFVSKFPQDMSSKSGETLPPT